MKPYRLFFTAISLAPFALQAQSLWRQFPEPGANHFFDQNGWFFTGAGTQSRLDGQSGPVYGHPLTANEVRSTTQTLGDGSHIGNTETEHFYRDSQGRMRTETSTGAVIYDPVAGYTYDLTFARKSYTKNPIHANSTITIAAAAHRSSTSSSSTSSSSTGSTNGVYHSVARTGSGSNGVTESLPDQMMDGINVKGSKVTITIPQGSIGNDRDLKVVNERYFSDDLKLLVKTVNTDPRFGVSTYELQNIVQGEPPAALFQVPGDYSEGH